MKKPDLKIVPIKPKVCNNPVARDQLLKQVNKASACDEKMIGYALVTFHEEGGHTVAWGSSGSMLPMDIPSMAFNRLDCAIKNSGK